MTDRELYQAVESWGRAHRDELVRDLIACVNRKSVSQPGEGGYAFGTGCKECADAMAALAEGYGFSVENDDYYTLSILRPGASDRELGILGHLDVVPEGECWRYAPYDAVEKDGFVIGRGSSDNKGSVLMSLYVMRALCALDVPFQHTLRLICGFNEEAGMKDVEHYLQTHQPPEYTLVCDGGWAMCIGEKGIVNAELVQAADTGNLVAMQAGVVRNSVPASASAALSGLDVAAVRALAEKEDGISVAQSDGLATVTAEGRATHAAFPWTGDNAICKLLRFLDKNALVTGKAGQAVRNLAALFADDYGTGLGVAFEDDISGKTTCVASVLSLQNGVLRQYFDMRYAITQDGEEIQKKIRAACQERGVIVENMDGSAPRYTDPQAPETKMLLDTVHEFLGKEYEAYTMGGGTHARKFPNALPYGPAGIKIDNPFGKAHGVDEAVSIESLLLSMGIYAVALKRLDEMLS